MPNIRYKSPTEQLCKQMTSNPAFTKRNIQNANAYLLNGWAKLVGHVSHSTELVRMCLACQHFDSNSADWFSDNLHVSSSWYLRTMGKERNPSIQQTFAGHKSVCVGGFTAGVRYVYRGQSHRQNHLVQRSFAWIKWITYLTSHLEKCISL